MISETFISFVSRDASPHPRCGRGTVLPKRSEADQGEGPQAKRPTNGLEIAEDNHPYLRCRGA